MRIDPGTVEGMEDFFLYTVEDFLTPSYFKFLTQRGMYANKYTYIPDDSAYGANKPPVSAWNATHVSDVGQFAFVVLHGTAVNDSEMFTFLEPMLFQLYDKFTTYDFKGVTRAKFNILTPRPECQELLHNTPHVDLEIITNTQAVHTALLYISGEDGDTVFFKERFDPALPRPETFTEFMRFAPKPNTLVFFNSAYYHASSNPRSGNARCVLNVIFDASAAKDATDAT